jgi:hypothetical protein
MYKYILVIFTVITQIIHAQDSPWGLINSGNSSLPNETVKCIVFDSEGAMWVGTYMGGLAVNKDNVWTIYNTSNSELPHNYINSIAIDKNNVKWIGTDGGGLARFDGTTWQVYKTSNSGLPSNVVMSVYCDEKGIIWVGTYFGGLARFDEQDWTVYSDENSPLLSNKIVAIAKDTNNVIWVGTQGGGLGSFDGAVWTIYTERNSKLTSDYIYSIAIDKENNKWIGTGGSGVEAFNGVYWISFNSKNSGITDDNIRPIMINEHGYKWIGTYIGGLMMFDGEVWKVFDYENSSLPDDEVTCLAYQNSKLYVGTERSGIVVYQDTPKHRVTDIAKEVVTVKTPVIITEDKPIEVVPKQLETSQDIAEETSQDTSQSAVQVTGLVTKQEIVEEVSDEKPQELVKETTKDTIQPGVKGTGLITAQEITQKTLEEKPQSLVQETPQDTTQIDAQVIGLIPAQEITQETVDEKSQDLVQETSQDAIQSDAQVTGLVIAQEIVSDTAAEETIGLVPVAAQDTTQFTVNETPMDTIHVRANGTSQLFGSSAKNKIVLLFDVADVYFDKSRLNMYRRSFKLLLRNRERINDTYDITLMIFSSNYDLNPKKIQFTEKQLKALKIKNVIYLEGETQFTEAAKKAFSNIEDEFNSIGNNHVIAATYKFINDDEKAKVVIKEYSDKDNIVFSLLAYETSAWKMEYKMKDLVPKGSGHYYSINNLSIKDNWSVTAQIGLSIFRGDFDVDKMITLPGEVGIAANKQVLSTGILNGGIKGQFNFGQLKGSKDDYSFENKYKEGSLNFQVILNTWINRNFRFEKIRPYAFTGIGFINYRVLLRDPNGYVIGGYGYKITDGDIESNGKNPAKDKAITDLMIPVGVGLNYKLNKMINLELEASSRFINSDRLDGRVAYKNDKYWFISVGITYMFSNKEFLADILTR